MLENQISFKNYTEICKANKSTFWNRTIFVSCWNKNYEKLSCQDISQTFIYEKWCS